ncbi:MAG TPA: hypothetical protein VFJ06_05260 [Halococcus sp.]|nr:hypothetical protein [Halococcus sp.]
MPGRDPPDRHALVLAGGFQPVADGLSIHTEFADSSSCWKFWYFWKNWKADTAVYIIGRESRSA